MNIYERIEQLPKEAQEIFEFYWYVSGLSSGSEVTTVFLYAEQYMKENYNINFREMIEEAQEYDIS